MATAILFAININAQVPQRMSFQAVVRNSLNQLVANQLIGMQISILKGSVTGISVYVEVQATTTNENGLATIEIGGGTPVAGTFAGIDWSTGSYYVKAEIDPAGGTAYSIVTTSQLLSVPYALYAEKSNNATLFNDSRPFFLYLLPDDGMLHVFPKISVEKPYSGMPSVTDVDGNTYGTVKIGSQVWMSENLKTTKFSDNTPIPNLIDSASWVSTTSPAYCWYNNDIANKDVSGALYNGYTAQNTNTCPIGWHVPSNKDWIILISYISMKPYITADSSLWAGFEGSRLIEKGNTHWIYNPETISDTQFSALPSGFRGDGFGSYGAASYFFSTSGYVELSFHDVTFSNYTFGFAGLSIRCIKN